jgi:hypothetical protein
VSAATLSVCSSGCPYTELAAAIAASTDGDTITLAAGTYTGGVTIEHSVSLVGAGAASTIIEGGGPVLTIGTSGAKREPTVSVTGVTVTGGISRTSPLSVLATGEEGVWASGGGIEIPPNAARTDGAHVTISDSVITGNRAAPTHGLPLGPPCPGGPCPFAQASGGGIDSWGTLTLVDSVVSHNLVGAASGLSDAASDSVGGGIASWRNDLTIRRSVVAHNAATATAPAGRFAEAAALFVAGGDLVITDSAVSDNQTSLDSAVPDGVDALAVGGGMHITDTVSSASIRRTSISRNSLSMTNSIGSTDAFSGGLHGDIPLDLVDDVISDNRVTSTATGPSSSAYADSGAGELRGKITGTLFSGNSVDASSVGGDAQAWGGAGIIGGSLLDVTVSGNQTSANSPHGEARVAGGGLVADIALALRSTRVTGNTATGSGSTGSVRGGGIFAGALPDGPPGGRLLLKNSSITSNAVTGEATLVLSGGGLYTSDTATFVNTAISGNTPDECDGC